MMTAGGVAVGRPREAAWPWLALLAYAVMACTYFVVRTGGQLAEHDTAVQATALETVMTSHRLVAASGTIYANGYLYTAVSQAVLAFTGVSVSALQQVIYPLTAALLVFPAWALYRELTPGVRSAAAAMAILFAQPEFLFFVLRGSHERVLRFLILIALWLLVRSFRYASLPGSFALHVVLFYLAVFGLIGTNTFFGISFLVAICTALVLARGLSRLAPQSASPVQPVARRLAIIAASVAGLAFVVVFYLYSPAAFGLRVINVLAQRTAQIVTTTDAGTNPYAQVVEGWVSRPVYFALASSDYLLMAGSLGVWLWYFASWLRRREWVPSLQEWLLWLLYGAFALQGVLAVLADRTGLLGANLQHRSFPSFAMVAAPMVGDALARLPIGRWISGLSLAGLALLALLKVTNEPALSNKWTFYNPTELQPLAWADAHSRTASVWVGLDERLRAAYGIAVGASKNANAWDIARPDTTTRLYVVTPLIRLQSARFRQPLPPIATANRIYDDGASQVFRARPLSAFQQ
jgi:hypothetical protein